LSTESQNAIAGMSLGGGRKDNFYFSLLQYFPEKKRWFLTKLSQVKDEGAKDGDIAIRSWTKDVDLKHLVVDFPLTSPTCETCRLDCPGTDNCHHPTVLEVRSQMKNLLEEDQNLINQNPKRYEQERNEDDMIVHSSTVFDKETSHHILSKSFKRKLKKGYLPYWNRPIDFWIWRNYYDQILNTFNVSYDSFGTSSVMLIKRFNYLKRHLPQNLGIFEGNTLITLIELYRANLISKKNLQELQDISLGTLARLDVVRSIEKHLNVFIYEKDMEEIVKNPKAFDSFLLSVCGVSLIQKNNRKIPSFNELESPDFIIPCYE
jgi:hypothetical protein